MSDLPLKSVTFVVPALNEEACLPETLDGILGIVHQEAVPDFEILVFDDGSTDRTGQIAEEYAKNHAQIRVFHHRSPQGIGRSYKEGITLASKDYYIHVPGDNELKIPFLGRILHAQAQADFIIAYVMNDSRPPVRRAISRCFTALINGLFGLRIPYFNGTNLIPLKLLRKIRIRTNGHAFMAEIIVRLSYLGYRWAEVGYQSHCRTGGKSKAFRIQNILSVLSAVVALRLTLGFKNPARPAPARSSQHPQGVDAKF